MAATALSCIFLLPTIVLSQWFPLDLGGMFEIGEKFAQKWAWIVSPYNGSGRYFPFYWIFNSFQYFAFGTHVLPYYLVQSAILVAAALLACRILGLVTGSLRWGVLLLALFFLNTPLAENSSTLGKAEPLALLLALLVLFLFMRALALGRPLRPLERACIVVLATLALLTKETSLALLGFSVSGAALVLLLRRLVRTGAAASVPVTPYLWLSGLLGAAWLLTKIPYLIYWNPADVPTYLEYRITTKLLVENARFYVLQQPDVLIFAVMGPLFGAVGAVRLLRASGDQQHTMQRIQSFVVVASLYAMALAYYLVLLVWRWPMGYYMLLPSVVFRLVTVYGLWLIVTTRQPSRALVAPAFAAIGLASVYAAFYFLYVVSSQISYSRLYTHALNTYVKASDGRGALVMESYPFYAEQVTGTHLLLDMALGRKFRVGGISDLLQGDDASSEVRHLLGISEAQMRGNLRAAPRKGDYVLVFTGRKVATWFLRGVAPYLSEGSELARSPNYTLTLTARKEIRVPSLQFNVWTGKLEYERSSLGYQLFEVMDDPKFFWRGRYPDGWIGRKASLLVTKNYGSTPELRLSSPNFLQPNAVTITKNGQLFRRLEITSTDEITLKLDAPTEDAIYEVEVTRTVAPAEINFNADTRKLGLLIRLSESTGSPS